MPSETENVVESEYNTEDMTVAEAKEKFKQGKITTEEASSYQPDSRGYDCTFLCLDGYFVASVRIVETEIEDEDVTEHTADNN